MNNVKSTIKFNDSMLKAIDKACITALEKTGQALLTEVRMDQVIPFDGGTLQNDYTSVSDYNPSKKGIQIISEGPYARRMYFHPEYNFQRTNNANARGKWYEDYISGSKSDFVGKAYAQFYKEETGL